MSPLKQWAALFAWWRCTVYVLHIHFLAKCTRIAIMPILTAEALLHENKIYPAKNVTTVEIVSGRLITSDSKSNTLLSGLI